MTPRQRIEAECQRRGKTAVVAGCIELLGGREVDTELVVVLGGAHAPAVLDGRDEPYWLRVWAARGLLWAWDDVAVPSLVDAMSDEAWRVREMACKVVARNLVDDALPAVIALRDDPIPRVRAAALRAVERLTIGRG